MKALMIAVVLSVALLISCASTSMYVPVTKPAKVNLAGIDKIAIGDIRGPASADVTDELTMLLFQSDRYQVLDRQHLNQILDEHDLTYAGLVNPDNAVDMGELIGSAALVFGRVAKHNFDEKVTYDDYKDKNGRSHRSYMREVIAYVDLTLQITDLRTGEIIAIRNISESAKGREMETDKYPPDIDAAPLLKLARAKALESFMRDIAPYQVREKVTLLTDDNVPELKQGVAMVKTGNWNEGITYFQRAVENSPNSSKAWFNLGVACEYTHQYDKAVEYLKKAYDMENKSLYMKEYGRCKRLQTEYKQLQEQLSQARR